MGAVPTYIPLMKAQSTRVRVPEIEQITHPTNAEDYALRRARLGIRSSRISRSTTVSGVSYEYRGLKGRVHHEYMVIARLGRHVDVGVDDAQEYIAPWKRIIGEVARAHGLEPRQLRSKTRAAPVVRARHEACYRIHTETPMTLGQIAACMGYCDHSVVHDAIRRHQERTGTDGARKALEAIGQ